MLLRFILGWSLIVRTQCSAVELATNLRGFLCLESSQNDTHVANHRTTIEAPTVFKQIYLNGPAIQPVWQTAHTNMIPVTVVLDRTHAHGHQIREALAMCSHLNMVYCPLDRMVCMFALEFCDALLMLVSLTHIPLQANLELSVK
jgi:hypothetical protein